MTTMSSTTIDIRTQKERAATRAIPLSDEKLRSIIEADDAYYRPVFDSATAASMATELLELRAGRVDVPTYRNSAKNRAELGG